MSARRPFASLGLLVALGAIPRPQAAGTPWEQTQIERVRAGVDAALGAPELRGAHVGFVALDTVGGTLLYARNADDEFSPASNLKLLTGSAALQDLGPGFTFVTTVSAIAAPVAGVVAGDLYLRGGGDAQLSAADLQAAALALARAGVRRVEGSLILDASHDDGRSFAPGWSWDDLAYAYAPAISALELEEGSVHVFVSPGASPGAPVRLRVEPASAAYDVENLARTGPAGSQDTTDVARPFAGQTIEIVGSYPAGAPESEDLEPSVPDPQRYAGDVLMRALAGAGIVVAGGIRPGAAPASGVVLWRHESAPMPQLLAAFWLRSDNLMGELLLKELGVARAGEPGSDANGFAAERAYLGSIGVDPSSVALADGSGLSVYDRITPRDLVTILQSDWNGAQRESVVDALPLAGVRGTLADAFVATALEGRLFAKTGSERHVRALSGFLQTDDHGPVTFSLLIDDWLGDDQPGGLARLRRAQAALLRVFLSG
jgi:D-alanyl-D-alanine carboxypeptidase/D-alanyl-D-alanine-endopeptidase (penicillin-binding protein 4)